MQIIIDLDGTICNEMRQFSRCLAEPWPNAVETVNKLYDAGHTIIIYSARTWVEYEMTVDWLKRHGVDRAITCNNNWKEIEKKLLNNEK